MGDKELTTGAIQRALDWAYDRGVEGVPGLDSAGQIAESYRRGHGTLDQKAKRLVRWQIAKAGTSGFVTGLGGLLTLPVAIPANIASVLFVQLRMIAAVAHLAGHDVRDDRVRTLAYACTTGKAAADIFKQAGITIGEKLTLQAIKSISGKTLIEINKKVGFRLLTKFGEKGVINLGKLVPIVGGVIGGTVDSFGTYAVGVAARKTFVGTA